MKKLFGNDTIFARFMNVLADIIWTGLLWVLTSIPIITMGAASCAAYQCTVRVVRGKTSGVTGIFLETFKENFRLTWPLKLFGILFFGWLAFDCIYLYGYGTDFSKTLSIILYVILAVYIIIVSYLYPLISRFDETRFELFKISFYLTFRYFPGSLLLIVIFLGSLYICYLMPWSVIVVPGMYWYLMSFPVKWAIGKMAGDKEDEEEYFGESIVSHQNQKDTNDTSLIYKGKYKTADSEINSTSDDDAEREKEKETDTMERNELIKDRYEDEESDNTEKSLQDRIIKKKN